MSEMHTASPMLLETQITERYGPLLTHKQLAQLLGRSAGGLRYSLNNPRDGKTQALKACARRLGRRVYYPAADVAAVISSVER